jgi:hypothetical protein
MISELTDEEILEFLMTSDFEQEYKPEEYKYLLTKWRYFYRILHGKSEINKTELEGQINLLNQEVEHKSVQINSLKSSNVIKDQEIDSLHSRRLTWKERISGKIIHKQDEN